MLQYDLFNVISFIYYKLINEPTYITFGFDNGKLYEHLKIKNLINLDKLPLI